MVDNVIPITKHHRYKPFRVEADEYFDMDPNLSEFARTIYAFFLLTCTTGEIRYCPWSTTGEVVEAIQGEDWGRLKSEHEIRQAITLLRKFRYIRHFYLPSTKTRIMEIFDFVGEKARE